MGTNLFHVLACCLLVISLAEAQKGDSTITPAMHTGLNTTESTPYATSENATVHTTTVQPQMSYSTAVLTPLTNSTLPTTATTGTDTPTFTVPVTATSQTTAVQSSSPDTTVITTANVSHTTNTTTNSEDRVTHGFGFNSSEKNITIVFSVALGVFAVAFVIFMFHRCKQNVQYLHQPFTNSDDADDLGAGDDTLVISGGLYDGHPIYDNVPTAQEDQSQFRLQFLH